MINKSAQSSDFVITRMITDRTGLHSVLLPLLIVGGIAITFLFVAGKQNGAKGHFIISRAIV